MDQGDCSDQIDLDLVKAEWPSSDRKGIYFNSGSCGVKPRSVLSALQAGYGRLNRNPTLLTFLDGEVWESTRTKAANLFSVNPENLLLTPNSTYGIQLVAQTFLKQPGDELLTTDQEHSCVNTISRYLDETRSVKTRHAHVSEARESNQLCQMLIELISDHTKLIIVSQINCLNGWRPNLSRLVEEANRRKIPLLADGAHAPGQGPVKADEFPLWVASGHKWMGAPNGTGFLYCHPSYIDRLEPLAIGDRFYGGKELPSQIHRLEWSGTCDTVKLLGLQAALDLQTKLCPQKIAARQSVLRQKLREALLSELPVTEILTPSIEAENCGILAARWPKKQVKTDDLRQALWDEHEIWVQPDFSSEEPGRGLRLSCHPFIGEEDIGQLIAALKTMIK